MAYTATITGKNFQGKVMLVDVTFTNGVVPFTEQFALRSASDLESFISSRITQAQELEVLDTNLLPGVYTPKVVTLPTTTAQDTARTALEHLQELVDLKIILATDPKYLAALAAAKTAYSA